MKFAGLDIFLLLLVRVPEYPARHSFRSVLNSFTQIIELESVGYESFHGGNMPFPKKISAYPQNRRTV